jgi:AraC-like DNA-binding protein
MYTLFEKQDSLNAPIETFLYDTAGMPFPVMQHWHYFAEFLFMLEGCVRVSCDEEVVLAYPGDLVILYPSAVHSLDHAGSGTARFIGLKFDPGRFQNTDSYAPSASDILQYAKENRMQIRFPAPEAEALHCREIFTDCLEETRLRRYGCDVVLRSQISRLLFGIIRQWIAAGLDIDQCPNHVSCGIENVTELIDRRLTEHIRVTEIADACHMSYSGFAARFRAQYGMSCKEYMERMRMYKAEEYLLFTSLDLTEISRRTGFSDCSHFIRCFKKYRGVTPKQFRMQKLPVQTEK